MITKEILIDSGAFIEYIEITDNGGFKYHGEFVHILCQSVAIQLESGALNVDKITKNKDSLSVALKCDAKICQVMYKFNVRYDVLGKEGCSIRLTVRSDGICDHPNVVTRRNLTGKDRIAMTEKLKHMQTEKLRRTQIAGLSEEELARMTKTKNETGIINSSENQKENISCHWRS